MAVHIEVVSDVVCPWCFIGTANLEKALAERTDVSFEIEYQPFLLDPTTPAEGADLRERLRTKYGADPEAMFGRVEAAAKNAGIPLDFAKVTRTPNTLAAHTLMRMAASKVQPLEFAKALFSAYFLEGKDIGKPEVLAAIGAEHGLVEGDVLAFVTNQAELEATRRITQKQSARGIRGVPFFVLGGEYGVSGAQPPEVLLRAIDAATK